MPVMVILWGMEHYDSGFPTVNIYYFYNEWNELQSKFFDFLEDFNKNCIETSYPSCRKG